jgi:hypothetical protein
MKEIFLAFGLFPICRICYKPEMNCDCDVPFEPLRSKSKARALLRPVNEPLPPGCYCQPGRCMAPVVMGRQMPCRDPQKAAAPAGGGEL